MEPPLFARTRLYELTAAGRGGLSVLALEGPQALAAALLLSRRAELPLGRPVLARLELGGVLAPDGAAEALDEAVVLAWSPTSVELHVHGSPLVVRRLRALFATHAALGAPAAPSDGTVPPACPPCVEEQALALAARAASAAGARTALDQARGALRAELARLALATPAAWRAGLERLERESRALRRALDPIVVVLAGPASAGKSTLFNLLLGGARALVGGEPGTTRDPLLAEAELAGWPLELIDTAGELEPEILERQPERARELARAALELARRERRRADLVLWLEPAGAVQSTPEDLCADPPIAVLASKADLEPPARRAALARPLAALCEPAGALGEVERALCDALDLPARAWVPGRAAVLDAGLASALRQLAGVAAGDERARSLAALLGPPPARSLPGLAHGAPAR